MLRTLKTALRFGSWGRFILLLVLISLLSECVPTPGVLYWEVCIAYGPKPVIRTFKPDGTIVEQEDLDTDKVIVETMHACRS